MWSSQLKKSCSFKVETLNFESSASSSLEYEFFNIFVIVIVAVHHMCQITISITSAMSHPTCCWKISILEGYTGERECAMISKNIFWVSKVLHKVISFVLYFIVGWLLVRAEEIWQSSSEGGYGRLTWDGNKLHSTACVKQSGSYSCMHGAHVKIRTSLKTSEWKV